jgi:RNA polymerase sigma-70 factor (ECF subfamily)
VKLLERFSVKHLRASARNLERLSIKALCVLAATQETQSTLAHEPQPFMHQRPAQLHLKEESRCIKCIFMRIKFIKVDTVRLLEKCRLGDRRSQQLLYEKYAAAMLGICRRYLSDIMEAEDALMRGFIKVFTKLDKLDDDEKFEYWMRRIMANECLMTLRKKKKMPLSELTDHAVPPIEATIVNTLSAEHILALIDTLPIGYKTVFNMYVIEGFKHKEIADYLNISVNTSKSQLIMARKRLQQLVADMNQLPTISKTGNSQ